MDLFEVRGLLGTGKSIYEIPLRVVYYARVSTDKDEQLHSLAAQKEYFENFINKNPAWNFCGRYIDEGISGTRVEKRESFMSMVKDAENKKFDLIITKEISRFSRSTLDSIFYTQEFLRHGVGVLFQNDNICTLDGDSELRLTIMASIAQDEVRKLSERCRFGFKRSIENGVVLGNDKIWGYKKEKGKLVIVPEEAEIVRKIFEMYVYDRAGIRKIARSLSESGYVNTNNNPFSFSTVKGILTNPKYKGYYCGNKSHKLDYRRNDRKAVDKAEWVMYKDFRNVPPIVSEDLWDKAANILKKRGRDAENKKGYTNKYKYSGKIVCEKHNTSYQRTVYRYKSGDKELWQCKKYAERGREGCDMPLIYSDELDGIVKKIYDMLAIEKGKIVSDMMCLYSDSSGQSDIDIKLEKIKKDTDKILARKDKLLDLILNGRISDDEFEMQNKRFNAQIDKLKSEFGNVEKEKIRGGEIRANAERLKTEIQKELESGGCITNPVVDSMIDRIIVSDKSDKNNWYLKIILKSMPKNLLSDKRADGAGTEYINKTTCYIERKSRTAKDIKCTFEVYADY